MHVINKPSFVLCSFQIIEPAVAVIAGTVRLILLFVTILQKYTVISRKVVGKNVHATIPKDNMGYDQYTVRDDCSCRIS